MLSNQITQTNYFFRDDQTDAVLVHRNRDGIVILTEVFEPADHHLFHGFIRKVAQGESGTKTIAAERPSSLGEHVQFSLVDDMKLTHLQFHNALGVPERVVIFDLTDAKDREHFALEMRSIIFNQLTMK